MPRVPQIFYNAGQEIKVHDVYAYDYQYAYLIKKITPKRVYYRALGRIDSVHFNRQLLNDMVIPIEDLYLSFVEHEALTRSPWYRLYSRGGKSLKGKKQTKIGIWWNKHGL